MNNFWTKHKKSLISFLIIFFSGGIGTIAVGPEDVVGAFRLLLNAEKINETIHQYQHDKEMWWEWARLITDNWDSTVVYNIADDEGTAYEVDVRWMNGPNNSVEIIPYAFVGKPMYRPYTLYFAPADGRMYVNLHDNQSGETQNSYLVKKK